MGRLNIQEMKRPLAIHHRPSSYSERWTAYCDSHDIPYTIVDCLDSGILSRLAGSRALLWHWHHQDSGAALMARQLIMAVELMGLAVFPSTVTCWHFNDKVGQKYLLESVGAPLIPTYVFYDLDSALGWIDGASFPKVFKLRKGAGSSNVRLVPSADAARALARQAFGKGFGAVAGYTTDMARRYGAARKREGLIDAVRRLPRSIARIRQLNYELGTERGYVYFQDFLDRNSFDTRVTIIGDRAFAFTRNVRPGDFRASGSGRIVYDRERIRPECVQIAIEVARRVGSQSMAFDFVMNSEGLPRIAEVSYCYDARAVYNCAGHWDGRLGWHEGHVWPEEAILIDLLERLHP